MFVTFEGPEGAGKTTLIKGLSEALQVEGHSVLVTREPGAGEVGAKIREILLHGEALVARTELFLFLADRANHVARIIRPALAEGKWVLCDRYADSTVVYQGYGRGLDLSMLREWNDFATNALKPDATILLDVPPEVGLARISAKDRLDSEPIEFHQKIRQGFLSEAARDSERWIVLDGSLEPSHIKEEALRALLSRTP